MLRTLLLTLAFLLVSSAWLQAEERPPLDTTPAIMKMPDEDLLPFWDISLADFRADKPRPYSLPSEAGRAYNYWIWQFRFRPKSTLEYAQELIKELRDADPDNEDYFDNYLRRIKKTNVAANRFDSLRVVAHLDTGRVISDLSSAAVRNTLEKRERKRYFTVSELVGDPSNPAKKGKTIDELKTIADAGDGWIRVVAVFPWIENKARHLEFRVYGLGRHFNPTFQPRSLLYIKHQSVGAAFRKALRFSYHRIANSGRPLTDAILLERTKVKSDWVWMWASRIRAGKFREIEIPQVVGGEVARKYLYLPYWIHNDTHEPQKLEIIKAGLRVRVKWQGQDMIVRMPDMGEADDFYKTQVLRQIRANTEKESEFVNAEEVMEGVTEDENFLADVKAKSQVLPNAGKRHFAGTIPPGKRVQGLLAVRFGPDNLSDIITLLVTRLRSQALTLDPKDAAGVDGLLAEYLALRRKKPAGTPAWLNPPEPDERKVIRLILAQAKKDLAAEYDDNAQATPEEMLRYNTLKYSLLITSEVKDWDGLSKALTAGGEAEAASPAQRAWKLLPTWAQKRMASVAAGTALQADEKRALTLAINRILSKPEFFNAEAFQGVELTPEAKVLIARDREFLSNPEVRRLNRLALAAAFPGMLEPSLDFSLLGHYLALKAKDEMTRRADEKKVTDVYFHVKWDGVYDYAGFPSSFRRMLPKEYPPIKRPKIDPAMLK